MKFKHWLFIGGAVLAGIATCMILQKLSEEIDDEDYYKEEENFGIGAMR